MKYPISLIIFLLHFAILCRAQDMEFKAPDYELIKREIADSSSQFYYPKLMLRLNALDTTLSNEDYRHLYYGYIFQPMYQPYWKSPYEKDLLKYYRSEKIEESAYDTIINLAVHSIEEFPFDLRQMNFLAYIYHLKGEEETARKLAFRFNKTIETIMSTGDGRTCETGFHVISVSHEYVIINLFRFHLKSQALTGDCDEMSLLPDERNIDVLYFNIKRLFEKNLENIKRGK